MHVKKLTGNSTENLRKFNMIFGLGVCILYFGEAQDAPKAQLAELRPRPQSLAYSAPLPRPLIGLQGRLCGGEKERRK